VAQAVFGYFDQKSCWPRRIVLYANLVLYLYDCWHFPLLLGKDHFSDSFQPCFWSCIVRNMHVHKKDLVSQRGNDAGVLKWSPVLSAATAAGSSFVLAGLCVYTLLALAPARFMAVKNMMLPKQTHASCPACSLLVQGLAAGTCHPSLSV